MLVQILAEYLNKLVYIVFFYQCPSNHAKPMGERLQENQKNQK